MRFGLTPVSGGTRLDLSQEVAVAGLLGALSYVAGPVLRWNHHRMMDGCVEGLAAAVVPAR